MRNNRETGGMCEVESKTGWVAQKRLMFCKGLHSSISISYKGGTDHWTRVPYEECTACSRYLYRDSYVKLSQAAIACICLLLLLILGTPQGVIRMHLLAQEGIQEAVSGRIEKVEETRDSMNNMHYVVTVNGEQQEWEVRRLQYACWAWRQE